jgi:hypothetical protein
VERSIGKQRRSRRLLAWQIADALSTARSTVIKVHKRLALVAFRPGIRAKWRGSRRSNANGWRTSSIFVKG